MKSVVNTRIQSLEDYFRVYHHSMHHNEDFWDAVASEKLLWREKWSKVSDWDFEKAQVSWYSGAELNVAENCLDRHLTSSSRQRPALIWVGNEVGEERILTFEELHREVCRMSNALESLGIKKSDRVVVYMPNIPELVICLLACARIGAIHSVIFGGFSGHSIQNRINDCGAVLVLTANGFSRGNRWIPLKENVDEAMSLGCPTVKTVITYNRNLHYPIEPKPYDLSWSDFLRPSLSTEHTAPAHLATDPLFILYTSGSTGSPKGVLHSMGGYLTYVAYSHEIVFQPQQNDVYWCTADLGWITGHSYLLYGPLANGVTTLLFEGVPTYPDPGRFWQIVDQYQVSIFYTAPTVIRILAGAGDPFVKKYHRSSLRTLGSVGEPIHPEAWNWYHNCVGDGRCSIVDTWWQTETGGILISPLAGISPMKPGSASFPLPGIEPRLVDDSGKVLEGSTSGSLVMARSWPGQMIGVYGTRNRFREIYFSQIKNAYFTGDGARRDEEGFYWISGRIDDVIKVSGHRLGTSEIEAACMTHPAVAEAAAVGVPDEITGEALHIFVVLKGDILTLKEHPEQTQEELQKQLQKEIFQTIRSEVGPVVHPQKLYWSPGLPKTRSGKIMRRFLRKIAMKDYDHMGDITTLADPTILSQAIEGCNRNLN